MEQKFFTMSRQSRDEYLRQKSREYAKLCGGRAGRSAFIDEVERTTALARKTVIRRLNHPPCGPPAGTPRKRCRRYDERDVFLLKRVWRESGFLCGKLLCGVVESILKSLEADGERLGVRERENLLRMSPATMDRLLKPSKFELPKRRCGRMLSGVAKEIPQRALRSSACPEPGHIGADTVALCGGNMGGKFFWILTLTDVFSGFTLIAPVWNKGSEAIASAIIRLLGQLPFPPEEFHCDNGSEFINSEVFRAVKSHFPQCSLTRSRPCHKNDNAHVEQKNGALVRGLFGEMRFDDPALEPLLERICALSNLFVNHFQATRRCAEKTRDRLTGQTHRVYEKATTPLARLLSGGFLSRESRERAVAATAGKHYLSVRRELDRALSELLRCATGTPLAPTSPDSFPPTCAPNILTPGLPPSSVSS